MIYSNIDRKITRSLTNLKKFTGKKITIISHSYGSLRSLYALNHLSQDFKNSHIH